MLSRYKHVFCATLATACLTVAASAQTTTGSVSGTVTDSTGAVISGAKVTATNVDTGVAVTAISNSAGIYNIRFLHIGKYKVVTDAKGFSKQSFGPFDLEVDQAAKVDVALTVGSDNTQVDVTAGLAPLLDTEDSTIATVLTANTIENVPLSGRNWSSLTLFTPGAVATNPSSFGGEGNQNAIERNQNGGGNSQAQVNGNRAEGNNYRLDGIEINETLNNLVGYNPNPDAIGQLEIISANAPAQYGNVNGGDVNALTKSGTNKFHGSAGVFLQNQLLDANTWANKDVSAGTAFTPRNPYTQLQMSATVGGPIIKDKLFFFADYFGTRYHQGGLGFASVLTSAMRTGDFSELLNPTIMGPVSTIQLYDTANNFAPYANNQVPITSPAVQYLIAHPQYYPLPNVTPIPGLPTTNNYRGQIGKKINNDQGDVKVDYTPSQKDRFFARYSEGLAKDSSRPVLAITFPGDNFYPDKGVAIGYSRTISNAIVNDLRVGFTRVRWQQGDPVDTTGAFGLNGDKLLGIPVSSQAFPGFASQSVSNLTAPGNAAGGTYFVDNSFIYDDDLSWQLHKHLLNIGVDLVRYQQNNFYPGNDGANGTFSFNGVFTSNPNVASSSPGFAPADWALDRSSFSGIGAVTGPTGQRQWRAAYYVQDDWKVMPNLTLNLGLRYQYYQQVYEVNNKTMNYNPVTKTFEYAGSVPTNSPYPGSTVCSNRSCLNPYYNGFMPRLGFSYQPLPKLVVRGGFGITKAMEGTGANLRLPYNAPFANSLEANGTNPTPGNGGLFLQETNGFTAPNGGADVGGFPRIEDPNIKPQATNEYSLTTEYQFNNVSSIKVAYVGELSEHLIQAARPNQLTAPCIIGGVVTDPNANPTGCAQVDPAPFLALVGENGFVFQTIAEGAANYNALQVQYRQRAYKGLEFTVNYALAHAFSNSAGFFGVAGTNSQGPYAQNAYDNRSEWGPTAADIRNSANGTLVYSLPFGIGKTYASHVNHLVDEVIGGWKLSMTGIAYSGLPVTVGANNVALVNNQCCSSRPNQISDIKVKSHSLNNWFGGITAAGSTVNGSAKYAAPATGTFGDARPGTERGPYFQQYDASLFKDFTIYHENRLGFRVDAYNLFNLTSLGQPSNNFSGGNFGQITSVSSVNRQLTVSAKYQF
jgi:hypothetical protein